jgi:hypothetical protein
MVPGASNEDLRWRYLIEAVFEPGAEPALLAQRALVIGGAAPVTRALRPPLQTEPQSSAGRPFLERRELGLINVGEGAGCVAADGRTLTLSSRSTGSTFRWVALTLSAPAGRVRSGSIWSETWEQVLGYPVAGPGKASSLKTHRPWRPAYTLLLSHRGRCGNRPPL